MSFFCTGLNLTHLRTYIDILMPHALYSKQDTTHFFSVFFNMPYTLPSTPISTPVLKKDVLFTITVAQKHINNLN